MTDIIKLLKDEEQKEIVNEMDSELDQLLIEEEIPLKILNKIAEINATNIMLIKTDDELRKNKLEKETSILNLKNSEEYQLKYKTLTQREEQAKIEWDDYNFKIIELEKKKQILQADKQGNELELRLYMKMLDIPGDNIETR